MKKTQAHSKSQIIYSTFDMKAKLWSRPQPAGNVGQMLRSWEDLANDKTHPVGQHPEDYALYQIGEWDDVEGVIESYMHKVSMGRASDFVKVSSNKTTNNTPIGN